MTTVFVDTAFFVALVNPRDGHHAKAAEFAKSRRLRMVTTSWVLTEVGDAFSAPRNRPAFHLLLDDLRSDACTEIVSATPDVWNRGVALHRNRADKEWSLTDCISFVVMHEHGLTAALTSDRHFEQAGFRAVLLDEESSP